MSPFVMRVLVPVLATVMAGCVRTPVEITTAELHRTLSQQRHQGSSFTVQRRVVHAQSRVQLESGERITLAELVEHCPRDPDAPTVEGCRLQEEDVVYVGHRVAASARLRKALLYTFGVLTVFGIGAAVAAVKVRFSDPGRAD
ncbi:MAG: hypothetical protein AAF645_14560 [Myxococcota bacterium]